jgi:hypothetical protein
MRPKSQYYAIVLQDSVFNCMIYAQTKKELSEQIALLDDTLEVVEIFKGSPIPFKIARQISFDVPKLELAEVINESSDGQ